MLEVQLLIVEYTGLRVRGGIQDGHVQVLRVINLYSVFGTIRRDEISLGEVLAEKQRGLVAKPNDSDYQHSEAGKGRRKHLKRLRAHF